MPVLHQTTSLRLLAVALTTAAVLWTAAVFCTPQDVLRDTRPRLVAAVYAAGGLICHQHPDRSFRAAGHTFPVCARCTGLYVSGALGALAAWLGLPCLPRRVRWLLAVAALPTLFTFTAEWIGVASPSNMARATAAFPLGAFTGWIIIRLLRAESSPGAYAMIC